MTEKMELSLCKDGCNPPAFLLIASGMLQMPAEPGQDSSNGSMEALNPFQAGISTWVCPRGLPQRGGIPNTLNSTPAQGAGETLLLWGKKRRFVVSPEPLKGLQELREVRAGFRSRSAVQTRGPARTPSGAARRALIESIPI